MRRSCLRGLALLAVLAGGAPASGAQTPAAHALIAQMIANEKAASARKDHAEYLSVETSGRTGGHAWTEHVVETTAGRVRFLLAVDGQPLTPAQQGAERGRLAADLADPQAFQAREASQRSDELRARTLLDLVQQGFLLSAVRRTGPDWVIDYRPDPAYTPTGIQDRVLHSMTGTLAINAEDVRLAHIDGKLLQDVSVGYGFLGLIRAGSFFLSDKSPVDNEWRTTRAITDIRGRISFFKTLSKDQNITRTRFHHVPFDLSQQAAVALAESPL